MSASASEKQARAAVAKRQRAKGEKIMLGFYGKWFMMGNLSKMARELAARALKKGNWNQFHRIIELIHKIDELDKRYYNIIVR